MTRKILYVALFLFISLVVLPKFCYQRTGNFWLQTILSDRSCDSRWATTPPEPAELQKINTTLSQPFTFLAGGMQSFVFLSEDKKTILKFFKHRSSLLKKGRFRTHLPILEPIFESYHAAFTQLSKETGVTYVHLNKTSGMHPRAQLIDKLGIIHSIDLDQTEFVLQQHVELICPKLRELMEAKNIDEAKQSIKSLVGLLSTIHKRGLMNRDRSFRRNVGLVKGKAVLFDAGSLSPDARQFCSSEVKLDVLEKGINLENWLMKNYPQLYEYYHERINLEF